MAKRLAIAVIHGMGDQEADFAAGIASTNASTRPIAILPSIAVTSNGTTTLTLGCGLN